MDRDSQCPACAASLKALREENELLREAARTFGELAERLGRQLQNRQRRRAPLSQPSRRRRAEQLHRWPTA